MQKSNKENNVNHIFNAEFKEYNTNQLQKINDKSYVELKHEFSDCQEEWQPMLYRKAVDTIRHEIEYVQGQQLSSDPMALVLIIGGQIGIMMIEGLIVYIQSLRLHLYEFFTKWYEGGSQPFKLLVPEMVYNNYSDKNKK